MKVVSFDAAFEIVGRFPCPAGLRIAAYNAQSGRARAVGDPMLVEEMMVTQQIQRHLEATDPNAPLRVMGRAAEAAYESHRDQAITDRLKNRLAFRPVRDKNREENSSLTQEMRSAGIGGHYEKLVQGAANYAAAGITDTTAFKRKRGISEKDSMADFFTVGQIGVRISFQEVVKEHAAEYQAGLLTTAEFEHKVQRAKDLLGYAAAQTGIHFSETRPFN